MSIGTVNFSGSRLREGREARAMTVLALADVLDVTRQSIALYEADETSPSPDVMRKIVQVLDLPMEFFLQAPPPENRGVMFYRSMSSATKVARARAERRFGWFRRVVTYVQQFIEFQKVNFPDSPNLADDPSFIDSTLIESVATEARRYWGLSDGPISNVAWLMENNGALIVRHELAAETLDAFSEWDNDYRRPFVVLGTDKSSASRTRYSAAHELGHMLLHRRIHESTLRSKTKFKMIEDQANHFAGAFLLPSKSFAMEFVAPTLDMFLSMKARWKVSIAAMIKRAAQLHLVTPEQETRLWINLARRGWRKQEPLDDTQEQEHPRFMARAIELLMSNKVVSAQELAANVHLRLRDVEDICGLRPNDLEQLQTPTLRIAPDRPSGNFWSMPPKQDGWVLPLNKDR